MTLRWPWRLTSGGTYKRDPGSTYGQPDLVWVYQSKGVWKAELEPAASNRSTTLPQEFPTPQAAMDAADRIWPVKAVH